MTEHSPKPKKKHVTHCKYCGTEIVVHSGADRPVCTKYDCQWDSEEEIRVRRAYLRRKKYHEKKDHTTAPPRS